jgi:hypothetical protein
MSGDPPCYAPSAQHMNDSCIEFDMSYKECNDSCNGDNCCCCTLACRLGYCQCIYKFCLPIIFLCKCKCYCS